MTKKVMTVLLPSASLMVIVASRKRPCRAIAVGSTSVAMAGPIIMGER